jgi:hypothetical protein
MLGAKACTIAWKLWPSYVTHDTVVLLSDLGNTRKDEIRCGAETIGHGATIIGDICHLVPVLQATS